MINFVSENLFACYLYFMLLLAGGCLEGIRRLIRRERIVRRIRP